VPPVSRIVVLFAGLGSLLVTGSARSQSAPEKPATPAGAKNSSASPKQIFAAGEEALKSGDLDRAEHSFKRVLVTDPRNAGAYANLGVIHMRRKEWPQALDSLHQAEKLAPQLPGIRLNIGLAYYRQADYRHAIEPFE